MQQLKANKVLVLDFGSPYTQVIARKVRALGVYSQVYPASFDLEKAQALQPKGLILVGFNQADEQAAAHFNQQLTRLDVPILVIGELDAEITQLSQQQLAYSGTDIENPVDELPLTEFLTAKCQCPQEWQPKNIIPAMLEEVRQQVGSGKVLLGLSGGVDSSVVAALLHQAIGDQLTCVFVDHGLLRKNEADQVMEMFASNMGVQVIKVDAEAEFMQRLAGETDPEVKRKIIGTSFIDVFEREANKLTQVEFLAQGTIYPDVIESVDAQGNKAVKSHHNVGGLPDTMRMQLVEPLRELFKDEVRSLGVELGLPAKMLYRHPFPGPGLGVRILGEVTSEYARILREADAIFIEELENSGWYDKTSQAFAVFLPVKSVGLIEGKRRYEWVIALRAVETLDFMNARWAHLPYELLETVSSRIITEIPEVSRVSYDISSKPPATIEWE